MNILPTVGTEVWVVSGIGRGVEKGVVTSATRDCGGMVQVKMTNKLCTCRRDHCHTSLRSASEGLNKLIEKEIESLESQLKQLELLKDLKRLNDEIIAIEVKCGR